MKHYLTIILALSILTFQFSEGFIIISFKINQEYIAKNLCIEKDVEGSACKGCCQLKKKLNENKKQKEQLPPQPVNKFDLTLFSCNAPEFGFQSAVKNIKFKAYSLLYYFRYSFSVFHPPQYKMFI